MDKKQKKVLIVCRGNIARSPVAEFFLKKELENQSLLNIQVISRGIQGTSLDPNPVRFSNISLYEELYEDAKPALEKLNIDISSHISTPVHQNDTFDADIIFAMDTKTKDNLIQLFPDQVNKIFLFSYLVNENYDFSDPENVHGVEKHLQIYQRIQDTVIKGFPKFKDLLK